MVHAFTASPAATTSCIVLTHAVALWALASSFPGDSAAVVPVLTQFPRSECLLCSLSYSFDCLFFCWAPLVCNRSWSMKRCTAMQARAGSVGTVQVSS